MDLLNVFSDLMLTCYTNIMPDPFFMERFVLHSKYSMATAATPQGCTNTYSMQLSILACISVYHAVVHVDGKLL